MTFSIVARCARTGQFGIAAATAMPAVGKLLTHAAAGAGAVATQARINPYLGIDGLKLLQQGLAAQEVVDALGKQDPRMDLRQVAVVDGHGRAAVHTGRRCPDWAGHLTGENYAIQGNRITGREVLERARDALSRDAELSLARRLMNALKAGDSEGGDRKGEFSATIYVVDTEEYPLWDIRVDQHPRPLEELERLFDIFTVEVVPQIKRMPSRAHPAGEAGEEVA
ncbi:MAG TPA: DUF1028 domain-containing protein [Kiloniellales bacterium]|jgi:uncharacterized Ntn-hydrolase superfamily protein|nr:DUF1028 domain-containing protein [Kiloniellales bacterium]